MHGNGKYKVQVSGHSHSQPTCELHAAQPVLKNHWSLSQSRNFPHFMKLQGSLLCLPLAPVLGQRNTVHILPSYFLQVHLNIMLPSTPRSSKWFLSFRFPHHNPVSISLVSHTCHMPHSSHLP